MSICKGINNLIDQHLGVTHPAIEKSSPHYGHKTSCLKLQAQPVQFNMENMIETMVSCIESNWKQSPRRQTAAKISTENWRFTKQQYITENNPSLEKQLEKAIVQQTNDDWVNQVPTASGLYNATHDKHRNIDLVHQITSKQYEFIELKFKSDTPLKAAIEVLLYGVLYVFARLHPNTYDKTHKLLKAEKIHLCVLAPYFYYEPYQLKWLTPAFNAGLQAYLANQNFNLKMDFQFKAFPSDFIWPCEEKDLLTALGEITIVNWS